VRIKVPLFSETTHRILLQADPCIIEITVYRSCIQPLGRWNTCQRPNPKVATLRNPFLTPLSLLTTLTFTSSHATPSTSMPPKRKDPAVEGSAPSTKKRPTRGKAAVPATPTVPAPQAAPRKLPPVAPIEIPEGTKNFLLAAPVSLGFFCAPVFILMLQTEQQ
jgi:hypothetical protein